MARKKRLLDNGDSDSSEQSEDDFDINNDLIAHRKRRRTGGKEGAIYGVFGDDSEDESRGYGDPRKSKSDWTKAPAFISSDKKIDIAMDMDAVTDNGESDDQNEDEAVFEDEGSEGEDDETGKAETFSDPSELSRPTSPRPTDVNESELEQPRLGGIGSGPSNPSLSFSKGGIGSSSATFISRGSIGSFSKPNPAPSEDDIGVRPFTISDFPETTQDIPSSFGKRSFVRNGTPAVPTAPLSTSEMANFNQISGSFGARMLAKMGWQVGTGLGLTGGGIVTPVETKLRPQKMGIAFKGFKEKTEQSKMEARRRGEILSDDEDAKTKKLKKKAKEQEQKKSDVWKRPKKVKTKLEHKTYEQILDEAGHDSAAVGIGQIIDATGAVPREVSSLADVSLNTWSPSNDSTRIPEIRYNIRLIADACKSDLDGYAREAKALEERKQFAANEDARLRKKVADETEMIERLQKIQLVANDINAQSKELTQVYEGSLEPFSPLFYSLIDQFSREFDKYRLDEIVVAAIAPLVRRMVASWNPLEDPTAFITTFRTWRRVLRVGANGEKQVEKQLDVVGSKISEAESVLIEKPMTPFESLLWNVWLPRVRTSINNDWSPENAQPVVKLYEVWSTFLPPFIRDNLLDQLILPKVQKAVSNWVPKRNNGPLQAIVFPWLPYVGLRLEDFIGDARRKVKSLLKSWTVEDQVPAELPAWRDVFDAGEWDSMILKYVVPKLGATLRDDFSVNPRDQKMESLERVLLWSELIRPSIFSQILEVEFFPKWLDVLHIWLIQPRVSFEEVAQWYSFWKESFPEAVQSLPGVSRGFTRGLQLMNKAIELGPDAPSQLVRPDFRAEQATHSSPSRNGTSKVARPSARTHEITFRSIVEEFAASHNLLFIPTGRAYEMSRMPLFRVSATADGKGGLLVYILDDAVWAGVDGKEFRAISLDDMVLRAKS